KDHGNEAIGADGLGAVDQEAITCWFPAAPILAPAHSGQTERPQNGSVLAERGREGVGLRHGQWIPLAWCLREFANSADLCVQTMGRAQHVANECLCRGAD